MNLTPFLCCKIKIQRNFNNEGTVNYENAFVFLITILRNVSHFLFIFNLGIIFAVFCFEKAYNTCFEK